MNQKEINLLLEEAAVPECSWMRRFDIRELLRAEVVRADQFADYGVHDEGLTEMAEHIFDRVFTGTIENRPDLLPSLFLFLAVVCGDRKEGNLSTDIDWVVVESMLPKEK